MAKLCFNFIKYSQLLAGNYDTFVKGIKPIYVFDGRPPKLKGSELEKRNERRAEAEKAGEKAKTEGNKEEEVKMSKRTVKVGREMVEQSKVLLKAMGIPFVQAPSEVYNIQYTYNKSPNARTYYNKYIGYGLIYI